MKTFVLGVGAQKAGTTWLHAYLNARRDANFGFCKEYHIHDARTIEGLNPFQPYEEGSWLGRRWRETALWAKPRTRRRLQFYRQPENYYNYFQALLAQPDIAITGDITPSYCQLKAADLRTIQTGIEGRGLRFRTIFLMRDPIERIISSVRMNLRKKERLVPEQEMEALRRTVSKRPRGIDRRSDYRHTLEALNEAFGLQEVYVGFYETLFCSDTIRSLCQYLELPYSEADFDKRLNVSTTDTAIPEDVLLALGTWQSGTLHYCRQRFPSIDFDALWPTASRWCQGAASSATPA